MYLYGDNARIGAIILWFMAYGLWFLAQSSASAHMLHNNQWPDKYKYIFRVETRIQVHCRALCVAQRLFSKTSAQQDLENHTASILSCNGGSTKLRLATGTRTLVPSSKRLSLFVNCAVQVFEWEQ